MQAEQNVEKALQNVIDIDYSNRNINNFCIQNSNLEDSDVALYMEEQKEAENDSTNDWMYQPSEIITCEPIVNTEYKVRKHKRIHELPLEKAIMQRKKWREKKQRLNAKKMEEAVRRVREKRSHNKVTIVDTFSVSMPDTSSKENVKILKELWNL